MDITWTLCRNACPLFHFNYTPILSQTLYKIYGSNFTLDLLGRLIYKVKMHELTRRYCQSTDYWTGIKNELKSNLQYTKLYQGLSVTCVRTWTSDNSQTSGVSKHSCLKFFDASPYVSNKTLYDYLLIPWIAEFIPTRFSRLTSKVIQTPQILSLTYSQSPCIPRRPLKRSRPRDLSSP